MDLRSFGAGSGFRSDDKLAFVEFDDQGEFHSDTNSGPLGPGFLTDMQIDRAEQEIYLARGCSKGAPPCNRPALVVTFVHGWKNDASARTSNVSKFVELLAAIRHSYDGAVPIVGIYVGWRGSALNLPDPLRDGVFLTFPNRKRIASHLPGPNVIEALTRITVATKGKDYDSSSRLMMIGHSFGGLILERSVVQTLTNHILRFAEDGKTHEVPSPYDFLLFINQAASALESHQFMDLLMRYRVEVVHKYGAYTSTGNEHPLVVNVVSEKDWATGFAYPITQALARPFNRLRTYRSDRGTPRSDRFGQSRQRTYWLRTTAHVATLRNLEIKTCPVPPGERLYVSIPSVDKRSGVPTPPPYFLQQIPRSRNTTAYWVGLLPREISGGHSDVFNVQVSVMLTAMLMRQRTPAPSACPSAPSPSTPTSTPAVPPTAPEPPVPVLPQTVLRIKAG